MAIDHSHPLHGQPFCHHLHHPGMFPGEGMPLRCGGCEQKAGFSMTRDGLRVSVCPSCGRWAYALGDFLVGEWEWVPPDGS